MRTGTGVLPDLTSPGRQRQHAAPISAWGHDFPAANVALQSMSGPWAEPSFAELVDEKPLPWSLYVEKEGDPLVTYFGENYGLSSIRQKHQRIHVLGHWRRQAALPQSMTDIGTLDLRIGFDQTTVGNDLEGVISQQGVYRCYQHGNKLILFARPQPNVIKERAGNASSASETPGGSNHECANRVALFNYEKPAQTWGIYIEGKKVDRCRPPPSTAKSSASTTASATWRCARCQPTTSARRRDHLEAGRPQTQAYHEQTNIQPALFVHANFYRRSAAMPADAVRMANATSGFVVELGNQQEYGSFEKFQSQVRQAKLAAGARARSRTRPASTRWRRMGQGPRTRRLPP